MAGQGSELIEYGRRARVATRHLAILPRAGKDRAVLAIAQAIRAQGAAILAANGVDIDRAQIAGVSGAFLDRLKLTWPQIEAMAKQLELIATLPDPVGQVIAAWDEPNGLKFQRVRTPLGVIGMIYESRPNVTVDAAALCLKAGNAVILRGGSDALASNRALHHALVQGLDQAGLPPDAVQLVANPDRGLVGEMLSGLDGMIDVIIPRGGKGLVSRVLAEARVPVLAHLEGNCHVYIHQAANLEMAEAIVINAKLRRTGVCGAAETLLYDRSVDISPILRAVLARGCALRGCEFTQALDPAIGPASEADWGTEYLDAILAVRAVDDLDQAMAHIARYGSNHTDAIVTEDRAAADRFLTEVDSAIVLHNASTQFADGGEFGFGAEIGIATGRLHARGPVGLEQLTTFKYRVRGSGQVRP